MANNLKFACRNIRKDKLSYLINVTGFAFGIVSSFFILIYVQDEFSYDKHFENKDNIYRLTQNFLYNQSHFARCAPAFAPLIEETFPEVNKIVRLNQQSKVISIDNHKFKEDNFFYADSSFFDVFDFKFINGDPKTALNEPYSIILTQQIAKKYFGNKDPVNESVLILDKEGKQLYKVTGVIEDPRRNSHFHVDILASFNSQNSDFSGAFVQMANFYTYLTLPVNYDYKSLEKKFPDFLMSKVSKEAPEYISLVLQPLKSIHLKSSLQREIEKNGDIKVVFMFSMVVFLILSIASISNINLSLARYAKRSKEISLRKVLGADKTSIIKQYFTELILFSIIVLFISLIILSLFYPAFKNLVNKDINLLSINNSYIFLELIGLILFVGFLSGIYPSLVLSSLKPFDLLKGVQKSSVKFNLRKALIVIQFSITGILIISSMVIYSQIQYLKNKGLGFQKENIVVIKNIEIRDQFDFIRNELMADRNLLDVTAVMSPPSVKILDSGSISVDGFQPDSEKGKSLSINMLPIQNNFIDFMQMQMLAGRSFSEEYSTDTSAYIINETALKMIGWESPDEAVGKQFQINDLQKGAIIGVVKDFNYSSLHEKIDPLALFIKKDWLFTLLIKTKDNEAYNSIPLIKKKVEQIYPDKVIEIAALDSLIDDLYGSDKRQLSIVAFFSIIAIVISCMGLFGLLSFIIDHRTKEIGLRKTHGASEFNIIFLFFSEFTTLIFFSNIIAVCISYDLMKEWLQNYAYHTNMNYWIFFYTLFITVIITLLTVSYFTIKAAKANPIDALKYE